VGELVVGDIGLPPGFALLEEIGLEMATPERLRQWLPPRPRDAHKGTFGKVLIVAGSVNYPGAVALAGLAAYRVGAGLVTLATPQPIQPLIAGIVPEATWILLPHELGAISKDAAAVLVEPLSGTTCMLLGPGFGQEACTGDFLIRLLGAETAHSRGNIGFVHDGNEGRGPVRQLPHCVVDADGLKLLAKIPDWPHHLPRESILTPHPGEMSVLTGLPKEEIQSDRIATAQSWAKTWGHIVVLKGAYTVVAEPSGRADVVPFATPALARAGTGDVLAGAIAGFRAQGVPPYEAAALGAYLHGRSGELAESRTGSAASVLARDVGEALPEALKELMRD
jgi:NAD(P)H-hydrate epimerase